MRLPKDAKVRTNRTNRLENPPTPEVVFAVVAAVVLTCLALLTPPGGNMDEHLHIFRIEQLCQGQLRPVLVGYNEEYPQDTEEESAEAALYGGFIDKNLATVTSENNYGLQLKKWKYAFPTWSDRKAMASYRYGRGEKEPFVFTNTAINAPLVYLQYMPAFCIGALLRLPVYWMVVGMRMCSSMLYILVIVWCIKNLPYGKWPFAAYFMLPNQLATVSGVTADTVTNLLFAVFITLLLMACSSQRVTKKLLVSLGIVSVLLPIAKVVYTPCLALLTIPFFVRNDEFRSGKHALFFGASAVAGLLLLFTWSRVIRGINPGAMWRPDIVPAKQLRFILSDPLAYIKLLALSFPFISWFQVDSYGIYQIGMKVVPTIVHTGGWATGAALLCSLTMHDKREYLSNALRKHMGIMSIAFTGIAAVMTVLIYTAMYLTYTEVGTSGFLGLQVRYFIPIGCLVLMVFATSAAIQVLPAEHSQDESRISAKNEALSTGSCQRKTQFAIMMAIILIEQYSLFVNFRFALFFS